MMTRSRPTIWYFLVVTSCVVLKALSLTPFEACSDFEPTPGGPDVTWGLMDCIEVWKKWGATIDQSLHNGYPDREILKDLSAVMRRQGSPCTVREEKTLDGTGSSVMRHMAAWLYAKEVGCDWTTPDFNQGDVTKLLDPENLESEEVLYCHRTEFVFKFNVSTPLQEGTEARRCSSVSWLHFFHLTEHSVPPPSDGVIKVVSPKPWNETIIRTLVNETQLIGLDNVPWKRLQISFEPQVAVQYAANVGSWDAVKRQHTRELLRDLRREFHKFPRPGYTRPTCPYDSSTLSFAIHIRLGDRGSGQHAITEEYRKRLDRFMDILTKEVVSQEQAPPLFHIFSQTKEECPSEETGAFAEFPKWPLDPEEVRACIDAQPPDDCAEKQAGGDFCYPERSGVFHVRGAPVVLNLDPDVVNTLGCMIEADGILMGCSAFGELAGVLSEGMKLFSVGCGGPMTWEQNQLSPPLAIAERGELWVPIAGSWRNPGIGSIHIFRQVLAQYLAKRAESAGTGLA